MDNNDSTSLAHYVLLYLVKGLWWCLVITAIGFGSVYLYHCTIQPYIPIYLIVFGVTGLIDLYLRTKIEEGSTSILTWCRLILLILSFCWLIAGSVWIYSIYPPNYKWGEAPYCEKLIYELAFTITTMAWVSCACALFCLFYVSIPWAPRGTSTTTTISILRISLYGATSNSADHGVGDV